MLCIDGSAPIAVVVCCNRRCSFGNMRMVVSNSKNGCLERATQGVPAGPLYHLIIMMAILMGGESVCRGSGCSQIHAGGRQQVQVAAMSAQVDILNLGGSVSGCRARILSWSLEEEGGDNNHIRDSPIIIIRVFHDIGDHQDGSRFDS
jgi:hypothetical protein